MMREVAEKICMSQRGMFSTGDEIWSCIPEPFKTDPLPTGFVEGDKIATILAVKLN